MKNKYRVSIHGDGQILNASGNPLSGNEQETIVKEANAYHSLTVVKSEVAELWAVAKHVSDLHQARHPISNHSWLLLRQAVSEAAKAIAKATT